MLQNFEELKKELAELAAIINNFKSEAVQVKLIEIIFQKRHVPAEPEPAHAKRKPTSIALPGSEPNVGTEPVAPKTKKAKAGRLGAVSMLNRLIDQKFFSGKATLKDIITHCEKNAFYYKPSDFSGRLARYVRDGRLKRDKNTEGQFEYYQ